MKKSELIKLAQQGHPQAIALLLNHSLQSHHIQATVGEHAGTLHILLESQTLPAQATYSKIIHQGLQKLAIATIDRAHIYGRIAGHREFAWKTIVSLREHTILNQSQFTQLSSQFASSPPSPTRRPNRPSPPLQQRKSGWRVWSRWLMTSMGSSAIALIIAEGVNRYLEQYENLPKLSIAVLTFCIVGSTGLLIQRRAPQRHPHA